MELEAARALVPWWILPAAALVHAAAAFGGAFGLGRVLFRGCRRADARKAPWAERARALYPWRSALIVASWAVPLILVLALPAYRDQLLGGGIAVGLCAACAAAAGLVFWRLRLARLIGGHGWTPRRAVFALATRALVVYPHLWAALALAIAMPPRFDLTAAALLAVAAAAVAWLALGGGFRIARALGLAPPAPAEVADDVGAAAERGRIPLVGVHVIDLPEANAYALPSDARILFTRPALEKLDRKSLLAIAQHELTHLDEPASARRTRAASLLVLVPLLALKPLLAARGPLAVLLALLAGLLLAKLLYRRLAALETRADAGARDVEPESGVYARALTEIHRLNLIPAVLPGTIHPHLYDRLIALGATPACPRPLPPSRAAGLVPRGLVVLCAVILVTWGSFAASLCGDPWAALALSGGEAAAAGRIALSRHEAQRYEEAATFYAAAGALDAGSPRWPAHRAMSLAAAGRVPEALDALVVAAERAKESPEPCADLLAEAQRRVASAR